MNTRADVRDDKRLTTHEVYSWALGNGAFPSIDPYLADRYTRAWKIDRAKFDSLLVCGWPGRICNLILSLEANKKFGSSLANARGFYSEYGLGFVFDLSDRCVHTGCLVPMTDAGLYIGMMAFRFAEDERPFLVRTAEEREEPYEMRIAA